MVPSMVHPGGPSAAEACESEASMKFDFFSS